MNSLRGLWVICLILVAGCSNRPPDPEGTFAPVGTLQGAVVDSYDQLPIEGAKVTINYSGKAVTVVTDTSGTFAFADVPASGNVNSAGGATGTYTVNLDMSAIKGDRKYKPYRTQTVVVQFTELRRADTTSQQTSNAVQNSVPVSYLVSNITFSVRQTRATISGTVYDEQLKLRPDTTLALVSRSNNTSVPNGATLATATTGTDGKFSVTGVEEGASYQLVLPDQNLIFAGGNNNYAGGTFTAIELGVETVLPPIVLGPRPVSDPTVPYVSATDPSEDEVRATADAAKPIMIKFSEPMNTQRGLTMVTGFRRLGPRNRPDDSIQLTILFDKTWNSAGTELTITPTTALEPGFRYSLDFNTNQIADVAGNTRSRFIPYTQPQVPDALAVSNGLDDLQFAIGSNSAALTVSNLIQEKDTADNTAAGTQTRAFVLESDPSATENSFLTAFNAGFYTINRSDTAYITWTAPTQPVRRYRIWTKVGNNNPILISRSNNPWGVSGNTRIDPLAPTQTAFSMPLSDLSAVLANETGGFPNVGLPNTVWNNNLTVQLGVSVVNADGQEGDITFITLKDNTSPAYLRGSGLGMTNAYLNNNDSVLLTYNAGCASSTTARVVCPKIVNATTGFPDVTGFGQRMVQFDLSEPVDAASVIAANVNLVDGTLANNLGIPNPNTNGSATESDATIASVVPLNVSNGRTTRIGVVFNNFFGLDTGDRLVLKKGGGALKDISGNVAKDDFLITAPMVDDFPPMMKAVTVEPAADTMTLTFTKWFGNTSPANPVDTNLPVSTFSFTNFAAGLGGSGTGELFKATRSVNGNSEFQVVMQFNDVGFLRGYNSTDPQCTSGNGGTRVIAQNFTSIDFSSPSGRSTSRVNDDGTFAYENVLADPAEPFFSPGAYQPTSGLGTRSSFKDTIAPRLSNNFSDRSLNPFTNSVTVTATTTNTITVDVYLTEFSNNENSTTAVDSARNPSNWSATAINLGADNWTGNTANDAPAANINVTVTNVQLISSLGSGCSRSPRYRLTISLENTTATDRTLGISKVVMGASVADLAGNSVGGTGYHATWAYDPSRVNTSGASDPGWQVK